MARDKKDIGKKGRHDIMIMESIRQEITTLNLNTVNSRISKRMKHNLRELEMKTDKSTFQVDDSKILSQTTEKLDRK